MRNPWMFIVLTVAMIGFAFLVGANFSGKVKVPVFTQLSDSDTNELIEQLNTSNAFEYIVMDEDEALEQVVSNETALAVQLADEEAKMVLTSEGGNTSLVYYELLTAYQTLERNATILEAAESFGIDRVSLEERLNNLQDYNIFTIETQGFQAKDSPMYDSRLQGVFGFSLFFVIYTIAFNVVSILTEKKEGVWDRMILSPVRKWEMYVGNLLYSFMLGYLQVLLVFCVFKFGLDFNFYGSFLKTVVILIPYVFSIVAISILVAGIVKDMTQFNVVMPLISVSMAMLGGAYWPLEIVSSKLILLMSKFVPLTYGMEALKGATIYGQDWVTLLYPMGMMTLMGVVFIGVGIRLFDRKA